MKKSFSRKNKLYDTDLLVDKIRKRTAMYTGGDSLESLNSYLCGVDHVLSELGMDSLGIVGSDYFYKWLANKYNFGGSSTGWANIITAIALGYKKSTDIDNWEDFNRNLTIENHEEARKLFFQLFDECREKKTN